jgi:hypothetical protein
MICCKVKKIILQSCGNFYRYHAALSRRISGNCRDTLSDSVHHQLLMCAGSNLQPIPTSFSNYRHTQPTKNITRSCWFMEKHCMTINSRWQFHYTIENTLTVVILYWQNYFFYLVGNLNVYTLCTHQRQCGYHFQTKMDLWKLTGMVGNGFK